MVVCLVSESALTKCMSKLECRTPQKARRWQGGELTVVSTPVISPNPASASEAQWRYSEARASAGVMDRFQRRFECLVGISCRTNPLKFNDSRVSYASMLRNCAHRCSTLLRAAAPAVTHTGRPPYSILQRNRDKLVRAMSSLPAQAQQVLEPWTGFTVPIEQAVTLPASWYTNEAVLRLELKQVLAASWQMVGHVSQLQQPGDFFCGSLAQYRYLVTLGEDNTIRAFHNVCRHHAAAVAAGAGNQTQFECPYHGWTYDLQGRLRKATRLKGIQGFKAADYGLHPIETDTWGPWIFLCLAGNNSSSRDAGSGGRGAAGGGHASVSSLLGQGGARLQQLGMIDPLVHLARREYIIPCNWKVFCDNYLDGGYHVPYAHPALAGDLQLSGYTNELYDWLSIQRCAPTSNAATISGSSSSRDASPNSNSHSYSSGTNNSASSSSESDSNAPGAGVMDETPSAAQRLSGGRDAAYAFVYPNLMINRYGPWMDTNLVVPVNARSVDQCKVVFDYWLQPGVLQQAAASVADQQDHNSSSSSSQSDLAQQYKVLSKDSRVAAAMQSSLVRDCLAASDQVQVEDIELCKAVQAGLGEPAYGVGRYAPSVEGPMFHFHRQVYAAVMDGQCSSP